MIRRIALLLILIIPTFLSADIIKVVVDDTIQPISAEYIERGIDAAKQQNASALLIELRTPGGTDTAMHDIISHIMSSPVPVIVYVAPSGNRAASAGFFILESADIAAMAPGTNTGASHPVAISPLGGGEAKISDEMKAKITNDISAYMRSITEKRGRNSAVAETAVRESKSFTETEALANHLIDVVAKDQADLLQQLEGRKITRWDGKEATLHTANQRVVLYEMTLKLEILNWLMDPDIAFIMLAIGLLALYFEFNHPGAVIPGVIGFFFVVLAIFALNILPVRYAALGLILVSFAFFALEAKFASHGVLTIAGIASLTIGALLLVDAPIPQLRVHLWTALAVSVPLGLITTFLMGIALRARQSKVMIGSEAMVGEIGTARTPLTPEGKVFIHGEIWNATANANVAEGENVRVTAVDGLKLRVEPVAVTAKV